jgi:class 3 adenylate cyclase
LVAAIAALKTRVGIDTGLVIVGEMTDAGGPHERGIVGEIPNIAAQALADPNTVVIAESTRKLVALEAERRPSVPHSAPLAFQTVTVRRQVLVVV